MAETDIIKEIKSAGRFDATVNSEAEALRIARIALPHAMELPPAAVGQSYPSPPKASKRGSKFSRLSRVREIICRM
jgi:hypothetical protein